MASDPSTAGSGPDTPQPAPRTVPDTEGQATSLLTRILSDATDAERTIMALLKAILTDPTVQATLPGADARAIHQVLASHAVEMNGAACRFPACDCHLLTCATGQPRPDHTEQVSNQPPA